MSNGAIFYYFSSKDELLLTIYKIIKHEISKYIENNIVHHNSPEDFITKYWHYNIIWSFDNFKEYKFIRVHESHPIVQKKYKLNNSSTKFISNVQIYCSNNNNILNDVTYNLYFFLILSI